MTDNNSHTASSSNFPPSDWVETTLGEVGKTITGKTPSKDNPEDWGDDMDFITPTDLKSDSKFIENTARKLSADGIKRFSKMIIPKNSIIVTCIGSDMGKVVINKNDCLTNQQINSLIISKDYDVNFVYYKLKDSYSLLRSRADGGSTMPILNKSNFESLQFLFPPLPEQQAIASVLSAFDDKIELLREQNKTLEAMGQVIFQEWFGKYGVDDELPEGWRVGRMGEEISIKQGKYVEAENLSEIQTEDKKYPVYGGSGIRGFIDDFMYEKPMVVLTCRGNGCGLIQFSKEKSSITNSCMAFENMNSLLSSEFIYFLSKKIDFESVTSGSAQPQITVTNLFNLEIIIPDQETLKNFDEAIQPIFSKIRDNSEQIQSIARSRDELLPRLMRGEVSIKF